MNSLAAYLDALSEAEARESLRRCCASLAWVEAMVRARPFASDEEVHATAERVWASLSADDWREAFAGHPRIGERASAGHASTAAWSSREQSGMNAAAGATARAIAEGNQRYEEKFGHVFLICATGKSAEEMLASLRRRLGHDPATELRIAAEEQAKITRLRLAKLVDPR